jgi:hypothetical protein
MSSIIHDFINVRGMFEQDSNAAEHAARISKIQLRKYERYGVIPVEFFRYLQGTRVISPELRLPERARTVNVLLDLLWKALHHGEGNLAEANDLRSAMLQDLLPWVVKKQAGSAQFIYKKLAEDAIYKVAKSRRSQTGQSHRKTIIMKEGARKKNIS